MNPSAIAQCRFPIGCMATSSAPDVPLKEKLKTTQPEAASDSRGILPRTSILVWTPTALPVRLQLRMWGGTQIA